MTNTWFQTSNASRHATPAGFAAAQTFALLVLLAISTVLLLPRQVAAQEGVAFGSMGCTGECPYPFPTSSPARTKRLFDFSERVVLDSDPINWSYGRSSFFELKALADTPTEFFSDWLETRVPADVEWNMDIIAGRVTKLFSEGSGYYDGLIGSSTDAAFVGRGTAGATIGSDIAASVGGAGTSTRVYGIRVITGHWGTGGSIDNNWGIYVYAPMASRPITKMNYGLYLQDQAAGINGYSIYSAGGRMFHQGEAHFQGEVRADSGLVGDVRGDLYGNVTGNVAGNSDTATSLARDPVACLNPGSFARGISADGTAQCSLIQQTDLPFHLHDASEVQSGQFAPARIVANPVPSRCVRVNSSGTALEAAPGDCTTGPTGDNVTVNGLDVTNPGFRDGHGVFYRVNGSEVTVHRKNEFAQTKTQGGDLCRGAACSFSTTYTIPANSINEAGLTIEIFAAGEVQTDSTSNRYILALQLGSTSLCTTESILVDANTTGPWNLRAFLTVRNAGAIGSVIADVSGILRKRSGTVTLACSNGSGTLVDWTRAQRVMIVQTAALGAADQIDMKQLVVRLSR